MADAVVERIPDAHRFERIAGPFLRHNLIVASGSDPAVLPRVLDDAFAAMPETPGITGLANPTSNKIYREIGYEPVCDVDEYRFERSAAADT